MLGGSLVTLLDLYTLWVLRHVHLKEFGRWPGYQSVHHPYERLLELQDNEFCGCNKPERLYRDCCKKEDLRRNRLRDAVNFLVHPARRSLRFPPPEIVNFVRDRIDPPGLGILFSPSRVYSVET